MAHNAHAPAPHITEVWSPSCWQGWAAEVPQSDQMDVCEQRFGSPSHPDGGAVLRALINDGSTGGCSGDGGSWATAQTPAQKQAESRPGAQLPPDAMAILDRAGQSAPAGQGAAVVREMRTDTSRPGQAGQSPPVTPSLSSLTSTPTRMQQPVEGAPAAADPTTGRGTRRGRDEGVPPAEARDTSGLDELPAPRDSEDASGHLYDNAASWVDDHVKKGKALQEQEQVTPSPYLPP